MIDDGETEMDGRPLRSTPVHRAGHLSKAQASRLRALIREHRDAAVSLSWAGGEDPADYPETIKQAEDANRKLHDYIKRITQ